MSGVERVVVEHSSIEWRWPKSVEYITRYLTRDVGKTFYVKEHIWPATLPQPYRHAILNGPEDMDSEMWWWLSNFLRAVIKDPNGHTTFYRRAVVVDRYALQSLVARCKRVGDISFNELTDSVSAPSSHIYRNLDVAHEPEKLLGTYVEYLASLPLAQRVNGELYITADWFNDKIANTFDTHVTLWHNRPMPAQAVGHLWEGFV